MRYMGSETYCRDIETAIRQTMDFHKYYGKKVLITGASGLIGSFITECFLYANENFDARIIVYAAGRSKDRLGIRFGKGYRERKGSFQFIESDITVLDIRQDFDYIIHAAGYGHPEAFRKMPAEVLISHVVGTQKILETARFNPNCRVLYISSGEVQEQVEHLTFRACYPVGKKAAETLCISYSEEYKTDVVIVRPGHTFGPNVTMHDNRAATQFILSAAKGVDIKMYSTGEQIRTFSYVADCVSGILTALTRGAGKKVYGVSSGEKCSVREFAEKCAAAGKCRVEMCIPDNVKKLETSPIKDQIISNDALRELGWQAAYPLDDGIRNSIQIIKMIEDKEKIS